MTIPTVTVPKTLMRIVVRWQGALPDDVGMSLTGSEACY
jgi:hypothetical protein